MVATTSFDQAGEAIALAYTQGSSSVTVGTAVVGFAQTYNPFGQVATATSALSSQAFAYDGIGRLIGVGDNYQSTCTTRLYGLDGDSNRTSFTSAATTASGGWCPTTATGSATQTSSFDSSGTGLGGSDRLISSTWGASTGTYSYDALGRATTIPSIDTGTGGSTSPGAVSSVYRSDNQISSLTQGSAAQTFTYDSTGQVLTATVSGSGSGLTSGTTINYSDGSGGPSWTTNPSGTTTSYLSSMTSGNLLDVTTGTGVTGNCLGSATAQCTLNLTDLRGNVVATALPAPGTSSVSGYSEQTEFGQPRSLTTQQSVAACYGWLGTHQKQENNLSGLVLMGVRVYNPVTGAFTGPDEISGGNDGPYVYPSDPINLSDLSGYAKGGKQNVQKGLTDAEKKILDESENGRNFNNGSRALSPNERRLWRQAKQKQKTNEKWSGDRRSSQSNSNLPSNDSNHFRITQNEVATAAVVGVVTVSILTLGTADIAAGACAAIGSIFSFSL